MYSGTARVYPSQRRDTLSSSYKNTLSPLLLCLRYGRGQAVTLECLVPSTLEMTDLTDSAVPLHSSKIIPGIPAHGDGLQAFRPRRGGTKNVYELLRREDELNFYTVETRPRKNLSTFLRCVPNPGGFFAGKSNIPITWKTQTIIPIFKNKTNDPDDDPDDPAAYHLIALSSVLANIAEHLVKNRLERIIESRGLLANSQYGFRKSKSTRDSLNIHLPILRKKLHKLKMPVRLSNFVREAFFFVSVVRLKPYDWCGGAFFKGWHTIFTDASKLSEAECAGVGTFHSQNNIVYKVRCPPESSEFTSKCRAILETVTMSDLVNVPPQRTPLNFASEANQYANAVWTTGT
ncbi:hypothetical protein EVAR_41701_1 [Eumeta japonica]|uniref:RNA-directed DNA polymerase from transposon X-element n=1 Tax=Eumeta variegata TaxID=151549 RepID=A0A4C1VPM8_EUMVA|nr:hypothetical protein EVAR_41701_1 [Eumeta japonica]